ncbi:MAG: energy-coupling factor ABC transporter ATP-binding protein [Nitrososphaerales archaeon]
MVDVAIDVKDLKYVYPDGFVALDDVSIKVLRGERVAILGPNGAGKSTLLMLINGLLKPHKGSVYVLGMPVDENLHKVRSSLGLVFQDPDDQLFCPTLWEDVTFGLLNMGLDKDEVIKRAEEALKNVGLDGYGEKAPHHLSAGEKKKAAIATVLAMKPEILVLDEPTANLDSRSRAELIELINDLHKSQKITLVTATHDVDFIPMVADRAYILKKGRIMAEGALEDIFSNFKMMRESGLEPPTVTRLFEFLNQLKGFDVKPLPLTIEQALHEIKYRFVKNNLLSSRAILKENEIFQVSD